MLRDKIKKKVPTKTGLKTKQISVKRKGLNLT